MKKWIIQLRIRMEISRSLVPAKVVLCTSSNILTCQQNIFLLINLGDNSGKSPIPPQCYWLVPSKIHSLILHKCRMTGLWWFWQLIITNCQNWRVHHFTRAMSETSNLIQAKEVWNLTSKGRMEFRIQCNETKTVWRYGTVDANQLMRGRILYKPWFVRSLGRRSCQDNLEHKWVWGNDGACIKMHLPFSGLSIGNFTSS